MQRYINVANSLRYETDKYDLPITNKVSFSIFLDKHAEKGMLDSDTQGNVTLVLPRNFPVITVKESPNANNEIAEKVFALNKQMLKDILYWLTSAYNT